MDLIGHRKEDIVNRNSKPMRIDVETAVRLAIQPVRIPALSLTWAGGTLHLDENLNVLGWQADEPGDQPGAPTLEYLS